MVSFDSDASHDLLAAGLRLVCHRLIDEFPDQDLSEVVLTLADHASAYLALGPWASIETEPDFRRNPDFRGVLGPVVARRD